MNRLLDRLSFPDAAGLPVRESVTPRDAARTMCSGLVVLDNGPVFAIAGNAVDPALQQSIRRVKGEHRGDVPVGATMPFDDPLIGSVFATDHLNSQHDSRIRLFLEDSEALTGHLGGLAFLRSKIEPENQRAKDLPSAVVSDEGTVQVYSPVGNVRSEALIREHRRLGGIPVMTSANKSGQPEIIHEDQAVEFARACGLPMFIQWSEGDKPMRPRSSYPVVEVRLNPSTQQSEMFWLRSGCLDIDILHRLLSDLPQPSTTRPSTKYPEHALRIGDLPKRAWSKRGKELRKRVLQLMGVDR